MENPIANATVHVDGEAKTSDADGYVEWDNLTGMRARIILAEYKDRLRRFGFNYLSIFAQSHGDRIETVFDDVKRDAMQELIEDMISVVQSFSARLYGRRSHKYKQIAEGVKAAAYNTS